jgi:hypothetical protein
MFNICDLSAAAAVRIKQTYNILKERSQVKLRGNKCQLMFIHYLNEKITVQLV